VRNDGTLVEKKVLLSAVDHRRVEYVRVVSAFQDFWTLLDSWTFLRREHNSPTLHQRLLKQQFAKFTTFFELVDENHLAGSVGSLCVLLLWSFLLAAEV